MCRALARDDCFCTNEASVPSIVVGELAHLLQTGALIAKEQSEFILLEQHNPFAPAYYRASLIISFGGFTHPLKYRRAAFYVCTCIAGSRIRYRRTARPLIRSQERASYPTAQELESERERQYPQFGVNRAMPVH